MSKKLFDSHFESNANTPYSFDNFKKEKNNKYLNSLTL